MCSRKYSATGKKTNKIRIKSDLSPVLANATVTATSVTAIAVATPAPMVIANAASATSAVMVSATSAATPNVILNANGCCVVCPAIAIANPTTSPPDSDFAIADRRRQRIRPGRRRRRS